MSPHGPVIGWDIGGVNTKVATVANGTVRAARSVPFEIQRDPRALSTLLARLATELALLGEPAMHAVTMTAELSQLFRTKREGVSFVLDALDAAFPGSAVLVFTVDGRFLDTAASRREPLAVAASNWSATARVVALDCPDALLVDVGTTTTDVIPIVGGRVVATGRTDPERLLERELVYLGAVRTPVEAIVHEVPLGGGMAGVSAEGFALAGDIHVWRGDLDPADYTVPTPDGRPPSRDFVRERLARIVCADRDMLDDAALDAVSAHIAGAEEERIARAVASVHDRHPTISVVVTTGLGDFLARRAAARLNLSTTPLARTFGEAGARSAPAASVALLLARAIEHESGILRGILR